MSGYRDGIDLLVGIMDRTLGFRPFAYSTGCKISDSTETGERVTKENERGKWKEKYAKGLSETITAEGLVYDYGGQDPRDRTTFPQMKDLWINQSTVRVRYKYRGQGELDGLYEGDFIITSLEQNGPADDDETWSITLENTGPVTRVDNGIEPLIPLP